MLAGRPVRGRQISGASGMCEHAQRSLSASHGSTCVHASGSSESWSADPSGSRKTSDTLMGVVNRIAKAAAFRLERGALDRKDRMSAAISSAVRGGCDFSARQNADLDWPALLRARTSREGTP